MQTLAPMISSRSATYLERLEALWRHGDSEAACLALREDARRGIPTGEAFGIAVREAAAIKIQDNLLVAMVAFAGVGFEPSVQLDDALARVRVAIDALPREWVADPERVETYAPLFVGRLAAGPLSPDHAEGLAYLWAVVVTLRHVREDVCAYAAHVFARTVWTSQYAPGDSGDARILARCVRLLDAFADDAERIVGKPATRLLRLLHARSLWTAPQARSPLWLAQCWANALGHSCGSCGVVAPNGATLTDVGEAWLTVAAVYDGPGYGGVEGIWCWAIEDGAFVHTTCTGRTSFQISQEVFEMTTNVVAPDDWRQTVRPCWRLRWNVATQQVTFDLILDVTFAQTARTRAAFEEMAFDLLGRITECDAMLSGAFSSALGRTSDYDPNMLLEWWIGLARERLASVRDEYRNEAAMDLASLYQEGWT